jgi:hypothetical protein
VIEKTDRQKLRWRLKSRDRKNLPPEINMAAHHEARQNAQKKPPFAGNALSQTRKCTLY